MRRGRTHEGEVGPDVGDRNDRRNVLAVDLETFRQVRLIVQRMVSSQT